ncbi:hypothetical protein [Puia dinghuensis]|uniref:Uncharacterized protein n=1 Tax=Puia dinghuensis TaxID=1792502 RepID=A0A8J2UI73_9BACT|nr:hypothetical protein [Puia dinghuensis]GGB19574.1 hypothetical protein GCM10011511_49140 [Puia dinghuensis]
MKKKHSNSTSKKFWEGEFKVTVSKRLNKLKGKNLAPEKLELANQQLSTMNGLPKA